MTGVTVRERADDDLPAALTALRAVHEADGYPARWPADPGAWLAPDGSLAAWVADADGAVVGGAGALAGTTHPELAAAVGVPGADLVVLSRLFVAPAGRGLGAARALVAAVTVFAAQRGARAGLDVIERSGPAVALYESLGWVCHGRARAAWRTQAGEHPIVRYYLAPA